MRHIFCFILPVIFLSSLLHAQDSIPVFGKGSIRISGGLLYQSGYNTYEIDAPDYPYWGRYDHFNNVWIKQRSAADNPLYHGATFVDIEGKFEAVPGVTLRTNLIGEHRGMSYGVYDTDDMIVYPKIHIAADTAYYPFGERIAVHASTGHISDGRLYEGLTFYNLDWQGTNFWAKWKYFKFEYHKIGDLSEWIGLNLGDADDWIFSTEGVPLIGTWRADVRYGWYTWISGIPSLFLLDNDAFSNEGKTISLGVYPSDDVRLYGQLGIRNAGSFSAYNSSLNAYLAGISANGSFHSLTYSVRGEYRYYEKGFNAGYVNLKAGTTPYHSSGSTVGEYLYPLSLFRRPFSQWAIFTEYIDQDIAGLTLNADLQLKLPYSLALCLNADINQLNPEKAESFLWAFYDIGLGWSPMKGILFKWSATNRGMNLERHYPTLYMYKQPASSLSVEWSFPVIQW